MAWTTIDNTRPTSYKPKESPSGIRVSAVGAGNKRYIRVALGSQVAMKMSMRNEAHKVNIQLGDGSDRGKIAVSLDDTNGQFVAKKRMKKDGTAVFNITLGARAIRELFSLQFTAFSDNNPEVIRPTPGENMNYGPRVIFVATDEFFEVDEDHDPVAAKDAERAFAEATGSAVS